MAAGVGEHEKDALFHEYSLARKSIEKHSGLEEVVVEEEEVDADFDSRVKAVAQLLNRDERFGCLSAEVLDDVHKIDQNLFHPT